MMCLGWSTKSTCKARQDQVIASQDCGALWFWISAAALGILALAKDRKQGPAA